MCVGDVHLGRRPGGLRGAAGLDPARLGPAEALGRTVRAAIEERADGVLLAGDVVEGDNAWFEAYGHLRPAVQRLVDAGIEVVAVAGNHDVEVLPRLAREIPGCTLLGAGGAWETHLVRREGRPVARIVGWSFPARIVSESPFARFPAAWRDGQYGDGAPDELPTLGLVHGELGASGGRYAPIARADLHATRCAAWLVGHEHGPTLDPAEVRPAGYLGSLTALDPGEPGPHGPWTAELDGGRVSFRHVPLAPLRFERLALPLDGVQDAEQLEVELLRAVEALHERLTPRLEAAVGGLAPTVVGLRIAATGRRALRADVVARCLQRAADELQLPRDVAHYFVESWRDDSAPALDLERLAAGTDPVAILARRVLALERDPAAAADLLAPLAAHLADAARHPAFAELEAAEGAAASARERALRVARRALEELVRQRGEREAAEVPA